MKNKLLKTLSIISICMIALILGSCGKTNSNKGNLSGNITLTYASWGDANLDAMLIDEFEKLHENVTIVRDTSITGTGNVFTKNLVTAAQANMLPDVFITDSVPSMIENGLVRDVSEYWNADEDAKKVYANIAETAVYNGKRLAIPSFQYIKGMLVNKTLLEGLGAEIPSYDWTFDEFKELCQRYKGVLNANNRPTQGVNGFAPNGTATLGFEQIMPCQDSDTLLYDAYDGEKFNYEDPLWIKYRNETDYFYSEGLMEQMTAEEKAEIYGNEAAYPFGEGDVMFGIEGSWNVQSVTTDLGNKLNTIDFYPFPAGKNHKIPVIIDFICVSSQTKSPDVAYEFAKFMSYGYDGWKARLQAAKTLNQLITGFPTANYSDIWTEIKASIDSTKYPGLLANLELLDAGVPDCDKWMPGYGSFWVWVSENAEDQGFYDMAADQLATVWSTELNKQVKEAYTNLGLN